VAGSEQVIGFPEKPRKMCDPPLSSSGYLWEIEIPDWATDENRLEWLRHPAMPPLDPEAARWFAAELQPHAGMVRAWLKSQFPAARDVDDLVQESLLKVIAVHAETPVHSPKAYLYVVARNLAIMQLRRQQVRQGDSLEDIDAAGIVEEGTDVHQKVARAQELEMLTDAIQSLPTRCRQVLTLRKIYGMSQKETAAELGISEHTVEIHTATGLEKINRYFRAHHGLPSV
jgi:RNA polymerase sigma factor (sigma-70 family)